MAQTLINSEVACEILKKQMNQEMVDSAKPIIDEALQEIENVMRKRLASMVIAFLDNSFEVERMGNSIRILVKHES